MPNTKDFTQAYDELSSMIPTDIDEPAIEEQPEVAQLATEEKQKVGAKFIDRLKKK